jgi:hypothetical protein
MPSLHCGIAADHGGSLGALTVVSGTLSETRWDGEGLLRRQLEAVDQAGFPPGWVHDVVWAAATGQVAPTLSLHAYLRGVRAKHGASQEEHKRQAKHDFWQPGYGGRRTGSVIMSSPLRGTPRYRSRYAEVPVTTRPAGGR